MFVFVLLGAFLLSHGFLLDGDTHTPTDGSVLSDKRYNTLMNLLIEERSSRTKLEEAVTRELLSLKQEVSNCQCGNSNTNTGTHQTNINNVAESNETKTLKEDLSRLQHDFNALKVQFGELNKNNSAMEIRLNQIEHNLPSVKQPQSVLDIHNETQRLEKSLQMTNNRVNAVTNDVNARKQDFIALFNRVKNTERMLENKTKSLEIQQNVTSSGLNRQFMTLSDKIDETEKRFENKTYLLEMNQNVTTSHLRQEILNATRLGDKQLGDKIANLSTKQIEISTKLQQQTVTLQQELDKMANKVFLTACKVGDGDVSSGAVIKFTDIKTVNGIKNLNSTRNSGTFQCEKDGIYLITVYILTKTKHGVYHVKKNGNIIASGFSSITDYVQTTSVTVVQRLNVNDIISVTTNDRMYVYQGYYSCMTIVQLQ